ncbi:binding-protein-dependent transport systems inner membrane component [Thermincola potens JR]|uniref:Binding-protein-dependent transport systems inner membrane component n=1 Tax=Thermincola potens (strain JR) TaxID=635013 RepID=D5XFA7_THEPJ|nr:ABC transporter permease [Thermincola ferriacetica]ADG82328.1 binding-protein-dependent transport systems inner membrane component [Thermincola potens JR]
MNARIRRFLFYLLLIIIWELVYKAGIWSPILFPSPFTVGKTLYNGFVDNSFVLAITCSLQRLLISYAIAVVIGVAVGILMGKYKVIDETVGSLIVGLQSIPSVVWLPLALLWFGMNEKAIIFITSLGGTWTMIVNTDTGVKSVPPIILRAARTMGAKGTKLFWHVVIPAAVPSIITGMRLAWAFAWRALMAGELLSSGTGLGQILMMGRNLSDMSQIVAVMIIIGMIGCLVDNLMFKKVELNIRRRWGLLIV